ncbi:TetR/AcrR family transcriptional regulator [Paraburkholderia caribensis]|uniref:TetR/AcrR family transcriptional regulator n=1 Tax=Paraburkholderia caribensis TaxID=75105 RepID=UPI0034D2CEE2
MKVSREQVAENRRAILDAASRLFREKGFEAITVAEVMKSAGLTHGGFYGYFKSKDDLIAQSLVHVLGQESEPIKDLVAYAKEYLSPSHRANISSGCPTAGLGAETIRQSPEARAAMTEGQRQTLERFCASLPNASRDEARRIAIGTWSAMVGAMVLSRLVDDPYLSDEMLKQTYQWIRDRR